MLFRFPALILSCAVMALAAPPAAFAQDDENTEVSNTARMDVRISQLEEQMRRMEGTIEQLSYENKQLKAQLDKANADTQYRLQKLETAQAPAAGAAQPPAASPPDSSQMQPVQPANGNDAPDTGNAAPPSQSEQFANSRDHYNHAFRLMQQAQYAAAGNSFASFTHKYPHDPLIGNAFYWLGETYYVRRDYPMAADNFRQGYEAMPSGPKAADNLLKLAMSLDAMKKDTEACVVLRQVVSRFGSSASSVRPRAEQEINRIGCN
jgi:tol-pal system protein YbgF